MTAMTLSSNERTSLMFAIQMIEDQVNAFNPLNWFKPAKSANSLIAKVRCQMVVRDDRNAQWAHTYVNANAEKRAYMINKHFNGSSLI